MTSNAITYVVALYMFFEAHHVNLNEGIPLLLVAKMHQGTSFWKYKVYADISGGSRKGSSNDSDVVENDDFSAFSHCIFGSFRDKAKIII